jgi:RNA polymerase sigma factor (sigma-70 family)
VKATDTHRAIEAVFRIEQAKLIAGLTRVVRDVGIAEELAQDALVAALEQWPKSGMPDKPGAWLMAAAKHRAIDLFRRNKIADRKHAELGYELELEQEPPPDLDEALDDHVGDDLLRLIFISCHPILSPEARAALTLRLLGGLTSEEIARAFLVPEPTIQQRIVRAKRSLSESRVPFEVPRGEELVARLSSVLSVIYLIFNEGYSATAGDDWMRPQLCGEALRLGRILAELARDEPEVHGLVALMEIQASRFETRTSPCRRAHSSARPESRALGSASHPARACGARACLRSWHAKSGPRRRVPMPCRQRSPLATRERAPPRRPTGRASSDSTEHSARSRRRRSSSSIAPSRSPCCLVLRRGFEIVDALTAEPALKTYHLLPSVRGDLLRKLGRLGEARAEFERAAGLTRNERERKLLLDRAAACVD